MNVNTNRIFVSPQTTPHDIECLILGKLGLSRQCISERTGLSIGQIGLRLKLAGIKLADYRNGVSPLSQKVIEACQQESKEYFDRIRDDIRRLLKNK